MPKALEMKLRKGAKKLFGSSTSDKADAYIYGTLSKIKKARGGHW
jgi:hypothetical protein